MSRRKYLPIVTALLIATFFVVSCDDGSAVQRGAVPATDDVVLSGADRLVADNFALLEGKRVGVITNHTARVGAEHLVDLLHAAELVDLVALFGPEHGIRGDDVGTIADDVDERTGVPVYSLYGEIRSPTAEMLEGVDVLVFDIQDIGPRFYTYISTMGMAMEAAAANDVSFVVLDRPNPIGGDLIEGFVREADHVSFVGYYKIPVTHGLTVGELALMAQAEGMLTGVEGLDLQIVQLVNWRRDMLWPDTGLEWIRPSPNMPDFETALIYPGACFFEGLSASEGRGTEEPFILLGAPWVDGEALAGDLNARGLPGLRFEPADFTPVSLPGMAPRPKFMDQAIEGIRYVITDAYAVRPVEAGIHVMHAFYHHTPELEQNDFFRSERLARLAGTTRLQEMLEVGDSAEEIIASWQDELRAFDELRRRYYLY